MADTTATDSPALYVGTYSKYNNGSIKGAWLKLEDYADSAEFFAACKELHKDEADPELMFQDYECFPASLYSECMGSETIDRIIEYTQLSEHDQNIVDEYAEATYGTLPEDFSDALEAYAGELPDMWNKDEALGYFLADHGYIEIPEGSLSNYFDYEAYGRDEKGNWNISENGYVFHV